MDTPSAPTCARHPDVETRLGCSACGTPICPRCAHDAATGYRCPDCSTTGGGATTGRAGGATGLLGRVGRGGGDDARPRPRPTPAGGGASGYRLPTSVAVKGTAVGLGASCLGGLLLGPILLGGAFFLLSACVIGWLVARAVFWATEERTSPYVRAIALTLAGFTVAIGLVTAGAAAAPAGLLFLAYPAAVYGGWIVVRQR